MIFCHPEPGYLLKMSANSGQKPITISKVMLAHSEIKGKFEQLSTLTGSYIVARPKFVGKAKTAYIFL